MLFADATVIQITQAQGLIAIAIFIFSIGAAWATLKMSVKGIGDNVEKMEKTLSKIQNSISNHKADITGLKAHTKYGVQGSPWKPSDEGNRLLEKSGFNTQYEDIKKKVFAILDKNKPRTLYDIEKQSYQALKEIENDPIIDPLKDYAVNHPSESLHLIFSIGSWVLRDDYSASKGNPVKHDKK